ncbi:hypothetical protein XENOCAPTIV_028967 [Xenoophorus captivus]|uniref:C-type lectin domain-containing protein n=1 Tax=Xenoophorus captivus TaxID=1517983 RepID=A0ABV0S545_9TELE
MATGSATGLWEVKECASAKAKFICRQNQDTSLSPEPPAPQPTPSLSGACPNGWKSNSNLRYWPTSPEWIAFQEAEYKFFDHRTTWEQAQRICSWFDSSLTSIHSAEEQAFLANTLSKVLQSFSKFPIIWRKPFIIR